MPAAALVVVAALSVMLPLMAGEHPFERVARQAFTVVGWEARTTNAQEMSPQGIIPTLWGRSRTPGAFDAVQNRDSSQLVALYTDYASDRNGAYTYVLGVKIAGDDHPSPPPGMVVHHVPPGDYAMLAVREHPAPTAVVGLWRQVWSLEDEHRLPRVYATDYELHHISGAAETAVELYVGLKK